MKRVTGIGGVFFKSADPAKLVEWYRQHLGMNPEEWGGVVFRSGASEAPGAATVWSAFPADTTYFGPGKATFMINYRVENLDGLLELLRSEGCDVDERSESSELGKFGWVIDPEGNRIELWEPPPGQ